MSIANTPYCGVHTTIETARRALHAAVDEANQGRINLCSPAADLAYLPPMHALSLQVVPTAGVDQYKISGGANATGIPKVMLDRLLQARRASVVSSDRVDDGSVDYLWRWRVAVRFRDLTGMETVVVASKEVDLSDGSPDALAAGRNLAQARIHGPAMAESKALNRAARSGLPIKGAMDPRTFTLPWVVAALVPHVDASMLSQGARDAIAMHLVTGGLGMFGPAARQAQVQPAPPAQLGQAVETVDVSDDDGDVSPAGGPGAPTEAQRAELGVAWRALGSDQFHAIAEKALGDKVPAAETLTGAEAAAMLEALRPAMATPRGAF